MMAGSIFCELVQQVPDCDWVWVAKRVSTYNHHPIPDLERQCCRLRFVHEEPVAVVQHTHVSYPTILCCQSLDGSHRREVFQTENISLVTVLVARGRFAL